MKSPVDNSRPDWIVVQYRSDGTPSHCWKLTDIELNVAGYATYVYWTDPVTHHAVRLLGPVNFVQVHQSKYAEAAKILGVEEEKCQSGKYPATPEIES